nr:MAG TPA: hypothetical protein [Caudoviricetes sp.]
MLDEDGLEKEQECSRYIAHIERSLGKRIVYKSDESD